MTPRLRSCLSTPLISNETLVGVLSLYAKGPEVFTEDHQRLVEIVARQVSPVLRRSIEYATSSLLSFRDPLTGLPNLEHLRQLAEEQNQLAELPIPTALIYVDVNELKQIGHAYGRDQDLRELVRQLRANLRAADVLFRLESDTFAVLLFQTDRQTASSIGARIKTTVHAPAGSGRLSFHVRISIAVTPEDGSRIDALVEAARRRVQIPSRDGSDPDPRLKPDSIH